MPGNFRRQSPWRIRIDDIIVNENPSDDSITYTSRDGTINGTLTHEMLEEAIREFDRTRPRTARGTIAQVTEQAAALAREEAARQGITEDNLFRQVDSSFSRGFDVFEAVPLPVPLPEDLRLPPRPRRTRRPRLQLNLGPRPPRPPAIREEYEIVRLYLSDFRGPWRQASTTERNYQYCPVCGSEGWNTYLNVDKYVWFCQAGNCRKGGVLKDAPMRLEPGDIVPDWLPEISLKSHTEPFMDPEVTGYLTGRGLSFEDIRRLHIMQGVDTLSRRAVFPFFDDAFRLVWFTARTADPKVKPKYWSCQGTAPLYMPGNLQRPMAKDFTSSVVICEGVFDAIRFWKRDIQSVALCGTNLSAYQFKQFRRCAPKRVFIVLDTDAISAGINIKEKLEANGFDAHVLGIEGKDPASLTDAEFDFIAKKIRTA